ncbi:MAG: hypothetical protein ACFFCW_14350 [Candidatus Hodarchaeota archaeon]
MNKQAKARKALRNSIKHWMIDIVRPLKRGYRINWYDMKWIHKDEEVKNGATHCALCREYPHCYSEDALFNEIGFESDFDLAKYIELEYVCPLYLTQKGQCGNDNTVWEEFNISPCLETAEAMVDKLIECYNEYV